MRKTVKSVLWSLLVTAFCALMGATDVMMAASTDLPDAGTTESGSEGGNTTPANNLPGNPDGIATETAGRQFGDEDFYLNDVDKRIVRIRPMATPIDQISRYAKAESCDSFVVKYYSVGTRPIKTNLKTRVTAQQSGASVQLVVDDPTMFTLDDTIRVVGVKAITDEKGNAYDQAKATTPDLVLCVCGRDSSTNNPIVYAVNGNLDPTTKSAIFLPEIQANTVLVRMGKACGELDVQTGRFNNRPTAEIQYCQNFMIQVEQSTFDKIAAKEADWTFNELEEDGVYDMRLAQENSYLFGSKNAINHVSKDGMTTWFTGGIWYMPSKDIIVGEFDSASQVAVISDDNLVDISKDLFVGTGIGNKRKILFCGSDMLAAFSKVKSEKFRLKESVEVWNLKFKSWETDFGELLTIHHELFDINGMSDCALAMDPEYLYKKTHVSWSRNVLDLKQAGIRNTDAVVLQEVSCIYLRYPKAHARLKLDAA